MAGGSAFTDFFTKTIPGAAKTVYNKAIKPAYTKVIRPAGKWIKDKHLISSVAGLVPGIGGKIASPVLRAVGLGRRRRRTTTKATATRRAPVRRRRRVGGAALINTGPPGQMWLV
jgi:hypothetical protein